MRRTVIVGLVVLASSLAWGAVTTEFLGTDATYLGTTIKGDWVGVVGGDGYHLLNWNGQETQKSYPAYATEAQPINLTNHNWGGVTDVRGVENAAQSARAASCWFTGGTGYIRIAITQNKTFILGMYMVDWDQDGARKAEIAACDQSQEANPPEKILTDSYNLGKWFFWKVTAEAGDTVSIYMKATASNVVASAITFDPAGTAVSTFTVSDQTSGSMIYTDSATVNVDLLADSAYTVIGYQLNETGLEPTEWLEDPPATFTITTGEGDKIIYAWVKDDHGNVASAEASIFFSTATPAISNVVTEPTGSTITVMWDTDIPVVGWLEYGVQGEALDMISERTNLGTSHWVMLTELLDSTTYEIMINAAASSQLVTETTTATEPTPDNVTWAGRADTTAWERGSNWLGFQQPVNPTDGTVTFANAGAVTDGSITNTLDDNREIGAFIFTSKVGTTHASDLNGKALTVDGNVQVGLHLQAGTAALSNGSLVVGTSTTRRYLQVGYRNNDSSPQGRGTMVLTDVALEPHLVDLAVGWCGNQHAGSFGTLDLLNATLSGAALAVDNLLVGSRGGEGYVKFDDNFGLTDLTVTKWLCISREGIGRFGDPNNGYAMPGGMDITLGDRNAGQRCQVDIGIATYGDGSGDGLFIAGAGGTCDAYLSSISMGSSRNPWGGGGKSWGTLDLSAMDSVAMDAQSIELSYLSPAIGNNQIGKLMLPPGTLTVDTVVVAHQDVTATGAQGLLQLNGTAATLNTSLSVGPRGTVETNVNGKSCGLDLPAGATLAVFGTGKIAITFLQDQLEGETGTYWGLRWAGNHMAQLYALKDAGKLTIDDSAVASASTAGVWYEAGDDTTCVTLRSDWGLIALVNDLTFEVFTETTQITVSVDDVDGGSFDPRGFPIASLTISSPDDLVPDDGLVTLQGVGEHVVTLTVTNDNVPPDTATADARVTLVMPTPADGNLTWKGAAPLGKEWVWGTNWLGGAAPNNPTVGVLTFTDVDLAADGSVTNICKPEIYFGAQTEWTVGGMTFTNLIPGGHHTEISLGSSLVIAGDLKVWYQVFDWLAVKPGLKTKFSGGALQVGTETDRRDIWVACPPQDWGGLVGELTIATESFTPYLRDINLGYHFRPVDTRTTTGILDLRDVPIIGGALELRNLVIGRGSADGQSALRINDACGLTRIDVAESLIMGYMGNYGRLGDPDNGWMLPADLSIKIGVDELARGLLHMGSANDHAGGYGFPGSALLQASSGGTFTAWLTSAAIATSASNFEASLGTATLDLSAMDSVMIDCSGTMTIGESTTELGRFAATVKLPAGSVMTDELRLGVGGAGDRSALLQLNGTTFTVATAATLGDVAMLETNVGASPCGLDLLDGTALSIAEGGVINVIFTEAPAGSGIHWGLRWEGDHATELAGLIDGGKLSIDDAALPAPAAVFVQDNVTYVGVAVNVARITSFAVTDATSGSSLVTNAAAVTVAIVAEPAEGETIDGYLVTETPAQPTEGWLPAITGYTIQAASDSTVTLYAFAKDTAGNVASRQAAIYLNTAAPVVSDVVVTDNGDNTATVTWMTDILTESSLQYGPVAMSGNTPSVVALPGLNTAHSATFPFADGTNYKLVLVNTEVASPAIYWPSPWPILGDTNGDCRVNILDLIFIRNKLNQPVGTGDNWKADVNEDTRINILDLIFVRNKLNTQCP